MDKRHPQLAQSELVEDMPQACADEGLAVAFFERQRWGDTPCCVHCGSVGVYQMKGRDGARNKRYLWRCRDCKRQYTVRTGTIFEESLIPMRKWAQAFWEAASCKNGVSALELSRKLQLSYKTSLFMLHRIRFAMSTDHTTPPKMEGTVEADETWVGGRLRRRNFPSSGPPKVSKKIPVFGVVKRGDHVRLMTIPSVCGQTVSEKLREHVSPKAALMTDAAPYYHAIGKTFTSHGTVRHFEGEYVKKTNPNIHSNTIENVFSRLKKSLIGTYMAVSPKHLHRYLAHTEFLYNSRKLNDGERAELLISKMEGKRLTYRDQIAG